MQHSITQPLARHKQMADKFETEPFECSWASEAIFFVRIQETNDEAAILEARPQISADGIHWVDEGSEFPVMSGEGSWFLRVSHFGGWLRLCCHSKSPDPMFDIMIHLVLKS